MKFIIKKATRSIVYYGFKYSPKLFSKVIYRIKMGRKLDLKDPKSLSEKINYLNLYENNILASKCADKFEMREYIKEKGYDKYLVELIGVYENSNEIVFENLPSKFALKYNHGCGYNIICEEKSKMDINNIKKALDMWGREQYGYRGGEFHYNKILPKIICEKYIEGLGANKLPIDYKIHCFNGVPVFTLCCSNREQKLKLAVYDKEWKKVDAIIQEYSTDIEIDIPKDYEKMLEISAKLSESFKIIRVDFYELDGKALIGELTYTPAAGRPKYFKEDFDRYMGSKIDIG